MAIDPNIRILLVEDAGTMRKMEAKILNQIGFANIIEAEDGKDAVARLRENDDIALIISDWAMPNMDGEELVKWVRAEHVNADIPFLMATGHGDKEYVAKAKQSGASGVIAKPFSPDELKTAIQDAFGIKKEKKKADTTPKVSKEGKVNLKMAHIQITDHLALGVLKHQIDSGRENPRHFDLETLCMASWNPVQQALEDGEVDGAFILAPAAMDLFSYDVPIKLVLFAHRNGSIGVRNAEGKYIKPYQQFFKHKTFLIPHKMSIHNMLAHMYFTRMGLRPGVAGKEAVNVLFDVCPPVGMPEYLKSNPDTCGYMVAEPIGSRAIDAGIAHKQFLSSEIWEDHPCCVVVFREETIDTYPEAVQEFTNMLVDAGLFIRDNVDKSARIALSFLDPQGNLGLTSDLLYSVLSDPQGITTDNLYPVIEDLQSIQEYMVGKMEIGRLIDLEKFVETRFADEACLDYVPSENEEKKPLQTTDRKGSAHKIKEFGTDIKTTREGKYLTFSLGRERYGIGIMDVREIIGMTDIHEVPKIPRFFKGVINLRDKVIPVMDLRLKFGMEEKEYHERTCIIVTEISGVKGSTLMGIIVDSVTEVANIREQEVEDPPAFGRQLDTSSLLGMAKLKSGVTILLDIDHILHTDEIIQLAANF